MMVRKRRWCRTWAMVQQVVVRAQQELIGIVWVEEVVLGVEIELLEMVWALLKETPWETRRERVGTAGLPLLLVTVLCAGSGFQSRL